MPRFFHLTKRTRKVKKIKSRMKISIEPKLKLSVFLFIVLTSITSYLVQANSISTKGIKVSELEQQLAVIKQVSRDLETRSLELQSMTNVEEKVATLNMEVATDVTYIKTEPDKVVAR